MESLKENKETDPKTDVTNVEEEANKALFDQPLILEGKRKRKSTEMFAFREQSKTRKVAEYAGGNGVRLGDIPFIEHNINKTKAENLKVLFRLCYDRAGTRTEIKRNLRDFTGYADEEVIEKKRGTLEKMLVPALQSICQMLGIETGGRKDDIIERIVQFLNKPEDLGKEVPIKRRRSSSSGGKATKKSKMSESDIDKPDDLEDDEDKAQDDSMMDTSQTSMEDKEKTEENGVSETVKGKEEGSKEDKVAGSDIDKDEVTAAKDVDGSSTKDGSNTPAKDVVKSNTTSNAPTTSNVVGSDGAKTSATGKAGEEE